MSPTHPLNKNWFHISNGSHFQTKHFVGMIVGSVFIYAILIAV